MVLPESAERQGFGVSVHFNQILGLKSFADSTKICLFVSICRQDMPSEYKLLPGQSFACPGNSTTCFVIGVSMKLIDYKW